MAGFFYYRRGPLGPLQSNDSVDISKVNNNRRPGGNMPPENRGNRRPGGNMPPENNVNRRIEGNIPPRNDGNRRPEVNRPPRNDGNRRPEVNRPPKNDGGRRPEVNRPPVYRPPQNNYPPRPEERRNPYGRRNNVPPGPPPNQIPNKKKNYGTYAVNPGAIRLCQNKYTYIWLNDGREFWIWLSYVGRRSIAGYRWSWGRRRWIVFGTDISNINEFECY